MRIFSKTLMLIGLVIILSWGYSWLASKDTVSAQINSPDRQIKIYDYPPSKRVVMSSKNNLRCLERPVKFKPQFQPKLLRQWWIAPKSQMNRRIISLIWS